MKMFRTGDKVRWSSQSAGSTTVKEGIIVRVVYKEDGAPFQLADKEFPDHRRMFDGWTIPGKAGEAYFISVKGGKTSRAKPKLYMPYPNLLELA
jgi:hypothetical protein